MKRVILHIGMHKTGTSSIQQSLASYDDGVTKYARFDVANHSIPLTTIFSARPQDYHIWQNQGLSDEQVAEIRQRYLSTLEAQLADASRENLIISGEDIGILRYEEKLSLIRFFESKRLKLNVICYTRDPHGLASSSLQQHIRGGIKALVKMNPSYRLRIECFKEHLPPRRVWVRDYEREIAEHGDIVQSIADRCRLKSSDVNVSRENVSLSLAAARLILRFNRLPVNSFGTPQRAKARYRLINLIARLYPAGPDSPAIDKQITAGLASVDREDLAYLRVQFGIDYIVPENDTSTEACERYFSDMREINLPLLIRRLGRLGITCHAGDSIDSILIGSYYHFLHEFALDDSDADYLRDVAIKAAEGEALGMQDAVSLMTLASRARPDGPFIKSKLREYRKRLPSNQR